VRERDANQGVDVFVFKLDPYSQLILESLQAQAMRDIRGMIR
jgi:hypothetical protein